MLKEQPGNAQRVLQHRCTLQTPWRLVEEGEKDESAVLGALHCLPHVTQHAPHRRQQTSTTGALFVVAMVVHDLSHKLDDKMSLFPGDPAFSCCHIATVAKDRYNLMGLSMGSHSGTHIDAPYHFCEDGKTVDELDLSKLVGKAYVVNMTRKGDREKITWEDLAPFQLEISRHTIVFIRTDWSKHWEEPKYLNHPFLDKKSAEMLVELGVQVLGMDTLNPDETPAISDGPWPEFWVHKTLLGAGRMIVENLRNLESLPSEGATASLLPLKLGGCDASPIRAVAFVE